MIRVITEIIEEVCCKFTVSGEEAGVNTVSCDDGLTPLIRAVGNSHVHCVKILLQNGACVNCQAADGLTAVIRCSDVGNYEILDLLVKSGSDLNAGKTDGTAPLLHAAKRGNVECAKRLIQSGAVQH